MYETRRNEILTNLLETDDEYKKLCRELTDNSMELKRAIAGSGTDVLFEQYADSAYARDAYELDTLYRQGVEDTISVLEQNGII